MRTTRCTTRSPICPTGAFSLTVYRVATRGAVAILTDDAGPAVIDNLELNDDVLTGNVRLESGSAKVTLRFAANAISGTIGEGKKQWSLAGRRTGGADAKVAAGDVINKPDK